MLTNDEHIYICAVRYALGRRTYIVGFVVNYMLEKVPQLSKRCIEIMMEDILNQEPYGYGDECDRECWVKLFVALNEVSKDERSC
jgi:hypothetical protein